MGTWNHRMEGGLKKWHSNAKKITTLDCDQLCKKFPFRSNSEGIDTISRGPHVAELYPWKAATMDSVTIPKMSLRDRQKWYSMPDEMGQQLTDAIPNLNVVEVDNTISPNRECPTELKVVELNAERGRKWMQASNLDIVREADVVILNEMDIGMARSDNQHTTRLMAHYLKMNYAWGLEFVELTQGTKKDRWYANKAPDFRGLHGNAILSKCILSDATIFRDPVGQYFSSKKQGLNANGTEKRLGGRMGLFARIIVDGKETVVGSVHKQAHGHEQVKAYIGNRKAVVAGDEAHQYCDKIGLQNIVSEVGGKKQHYTWPASCKSLGKHRGDNICSNMNVRGEEKTTLPCFTQFGYQTKLGDHALTSAVFEP